MAASSANRGRIWQGLAAGLITVACLLSFLSYRDAPFASGIESQGLHWRYRLRGALPPPPGLAILAIDDKTIAGLRGWPMQRRNLGNLIAKLAESGAKAVAVDLLLLDREASGGEGLSEGDTELRRAIAGYGKVALSLAVTFGDVQARVLPGDKILERAAYKIVQYRPGSIDQPVGKGALLPFEALRDVAELGHVNVLLEEDGGLRHFYLALPLGDYRIQALPVAFARLMEGLAEDDVALVTGKNLLLGSRRVPLDERNRMAINYYGPPGTVPTYSLIDFLEGRLPETAVRGRGILIGATALGVGDTFPTPFSSALAGVEILATVTDNILRGTALRIGESAIALSILSILLCGIGAFLLGRLPSRSLAATAVLGLAGLWLAAATFLFARWQIWVNVTFPMIALLANAALVLIVRSVVERRRRAQVERQRRNLSRYHSPLIADLLAEDEPQSLREHEQPAAILFVDMAGFTGRLEAMAPAETVAFLRDFHQRIEKAVLAHGGVLEQFTGDGAMVIFGVPRPQPDDAARAVASARQLRSDIAAWSAELQAAGQPPLKIGIGVHFGPVIIAKLGGQQQHHLTAAGDTVNVASRLEALTRSVNATIVLSSATVAGVREVQRDDLLEGFERLPSQAIRGRAGRIEVWIA